MSRDLYQLNTRRLKNSGLHKCAVFEEDYQRVIPKIEMLQRLSEIERSMYAVFDMHRGNYLMKSEEQKRLFGFSKGNADIDSEVLYRNIHPDDLGFVLETDNLVYGFFSELAASEKKAYKLVYDFRVKDTAGEYRHYLHQVVVLEQDRNGRSWLMLIITDLLSGGAFNKKLQRRLINTKTGELHLFNNAEDRSSGILLTKREVEILNYLALGYDSKSISTKLHISVNTVNNHRQNILGKTATENTTQAVWYCKRLGLL